MTNQNYLSIYAKSFNWAGFFLPKQTYQKCSALYDFCRVADNIADDNDTIESKKNKFKNFESNFNNKNFDDPIIKNMWVLVNEFNISLKIIDVLFECKNNDLLPALYFLVDEKYTKELFKRLYIDLENREKDWYPYHYDILEKKDKEYEDSKTRIDVYKSSIKIKICSDGYLFK